MLGRRRPDTAMDSLPDDIQPGDYWKCTIPDGGAPVHVDEPTNLTGTMWMVYPPNGCGIGSLRKHTVREEEDGTASVRPNDGSSNSILINHGRNGPSWHGYLEHGVWREV